MDLELFEDSLGKTCSENVRSGSKFRPKPKPPHVKRNSQTPISSGVVNAGSDHLCSTESVNVDSCVALDSVVDSFGSDNCHSGFENRVVEVADIVTDLESQDDSVRDFSTVLGHPVPSPEPPDDHISGSGDLEFFEDIQGETSMENVRAGSKFRPKAEPRQVQKNLQKTTSSDQLLSIEKENVGSSVALDSVVDSFSNDHQHLGLENWMLGSADIFIGLGTLGDLFSDAATVLGNHLPSSESPNDHISGSKHRLANLVYPAVDDDPVSIADIHNISQPELSSAFQDPLTGSNPFAVTSHGVTDNESHLSSDDVADDEFQVDEEYQKKKLLNKSMKPIVKQKKDSESSDQAAREPRKKFLHTTWRRKNKLEASDDKIRCRKMPLKLLNELAELREGKVRKVEETSRARGGKSNDDEKCLRGGGSSGYINSHTLKGKTPRSVWSAPDTELFYQAFYLFKTDFAMIQQFFFPSKTRNQVKAKYKKEQLKHPTRIRDAETSQAKDESFLRCLKQNASEEKQNTSRADSVSLSGEQEMEGETPEAADALVDEAEKSEQMDDTVMHENTEADDVLETQSNTETNDEDFLYQYKSEL